MSTSFAIFVVIILTGAGCGKPEAKSLEGDMTTTTDLTAAVFAPQFFVPKISGLAPQEDPAAQVVKEFMLAAPITTWPTDKEEVWFGKTYYADGPSTSGDSYAFLRIKSGAGDYTVVVNKENILPYAGFISALDVDGYSQDNDAINLLQAIKKGELPTKPSESGKNKNGALEYITQAESRSGYFTLVKSIGKSTVISGKNPIWLRQKGDKLLVIERTSRSRFIFSTSTASFSAGRYSELWRVPNSK
ncbi:MAG: hypothetical protein EXS55_05010 [Candidatus Magasanikbacteria bacterium]|nr:hypothetical protein [Candidatus Magasanikbacteria bacterium]